MRQPSLSGKVLNTDGQKPLILVQDREFKISLLGKSRSSNYLLLQAKDLSDITCHNLLASEADT